MRKKFNIRIDEILFQHKKMKTLKFEVCNLLSDLKSIERSGGRVIEIEIVRTELKRILDALSLDEVLTRRK